MDSYVVSLCLCQIDLSLCHLPKINLLRCFFPIFVLHKSSYRSHTNKLLKTMKRASILLSAILSASQTDQIAATFTIAAADSNSGQIGASGSSCVDGHLYEVAYHSISNHGLCMTQGSPPSNPDWNPDATELSPVYGVIDTLLANDTDPSVIIDTITDPKLDDEKFMFFWNAVNYRQYGCVDLQGRAAGYTGKNLDKLYAVMTRGKENVQEDVQGTLGDIVYSAQGNIVSSTTVSTLEDTFIFDGACDLVERLYNSLAAVFESDELIGDIRCFDTNESAGSAVFIHVDNPDGSEVISIQNGDPNTSVDPWEEFKGEYEAWRADNPCPAAEEASIAVSM